MNSDFSKIAKNYSENNDKVSPRTEKEILKSLKSNYVGKKINDKKPM